MKKINMDNYHGMKYPKGAIFLGSNPALALIIKCKCLLGHHGILRHNQEIQREFRRIHQEFVTLIQIVMSQEFVENRNELQNCWKLFNFPILRK